MEFTMSPRIFARWAAVLLTTLSACRQSQSTSPQDGTLVIGRGRFGISDGRNDTSARDGNITVALKHAGSPAVACSGVLLTPTVVATAAACLADTLAGKTPEVYFGSNLATAAKLSVIGVEAMPASASGAPGPLALVYLAEGNPVYEYDGMSYQTFGLPDWAGTPYEVAGWSPAGSDGQPRPGSASVRQYAVLTDSGFFLQASAQSPGDVRWIRATRQMEVADAGFESARLEGADLGGPLMFQAGAGQTRQVIGILTQVNASAPQLEGCASETCDGWVALGPVNDGMDTPAVAWIKSKLATTHSPRWEAAHWRQPVHGEGEATWWRGEVDYYGPCRSDRDSDCDHWFDYNEVSGCSGTPQQGCERDNCIHWPNMDQLDQNDDMSGDACQPPVPVQMAAFNPTFMTPACLNAGSRCSSGDLLLGRAQLGPEPNAPNTLGGSCADGVNGAYHQDESIDRISVGTLNGTALAPGAFVKVVVDAWAYSGYTSDRLDLFVASDARNPSWTFIQTLAPSQAGQNTLETTFVLPNGELQAIRAVFRYIGTSGTSQVCPTGPYDDKDDLVFATNNRVCPPGLSWNGMTCANACPPGLAWNGTTCVDICLVGNGGCHTYATCAPNSTGRTCTCKPGFQGNGVICTDMDECLTDNGGCSQYAWCTNTVGSRTCACKAGFSGDGITCNDINECLTNNGGCSPYAACTNTVGSRTCQCGPMYQGDGVTCTRKPLVVEGPYNWQQGSAMVDLGKWSGRMCWLSRMTGSFMGSGEGLLIEYFDFNRFYLGGWSQQVGVAGSAMCATSDAMFLSHEGWSQGNRPVNLGPADGQVCFLTSVSGRFEGWGEYVHTYISNGAWYLGGSSNQSGVEAGAACFRGLYHSEEYVWNQGDPPVAMAGPGTACALTFIGGKFKGSGEWVNITNNGGYLSLGGGSQQTDVQARARCFW